MKSSVKGTIFSAGDIVESSQGGLESMISSFMQENDSKAKLLGRADGQKVIGYLQEEAVAENLQFAEEERTSTSYKTRHSVMAEEITLELANRRDLKSQDIVSHAVNDNRVTKAVHNPLHIQTSNEKPSASVKSDAEVRKLDNDRENKKGDGCCIIS